MRPGLRRTDLGPPPDVTPTSSCTGEPRVDVAPGLFVTVEGPVVGLAPFLDNSLCPLFPDDTGFGYRGSY